MVGDYAIAANVTQRLRQAPVSPPGAATPQQQLYWNGRLDLVAGPERIEDNWWLEAISRDYYIARSESGSHYWIYRELDGERRWFLQGVFE